MELIHSAQLVPESELPVTQNDPCSAPGVDVNVDGLVLLWADVDCDSDVDIGDALKIARWLIQLPFTQLEPCPDIGDLVGTGPG
jgi:hypothetical protein